MDDQVIYPAFALVVTLAVWLGYMFVFQIDAARRRSEWVVAHLLVYFWWWGLLAVFCTTMTFSTAKVLRDLAS